MSPGLNAFSDLPGKARALFRKRPFELLFLFACLAAAASLAAAYRANASRISLEVEGPVAAAPNIKTYGVSKKGEVLELERRGRAWVSADGEYVRTLLLALPKGGLAGLTKVRVGTGKRVTEFSAEDFRGFSLLRLGAVEEQEWDIYSLPGSARDARSLFPGFSPLNWRGDSAFFFTAALRFSLYSLCLLLILALLEPAFLTGRLGAAGGQLREKEGTAPPLLAAMNRPVWASRADGPERAFKVGRSFHLWLVFLLTFGIVGALSVLRVDPHHDGVMLKPACDVASGRTLFRDTFTQYGALTTWAQALAVKIAGKHLLALRLQTALTYGLIAVLMWLIYSRFLPNYLATFSCLAWLFSCYFFLNYPGMFILPWSTLFAVCSALLGLYLLLRFLESGSRRALFASGLVTALTFWFKVNYGGASFLAALLFLGVLLLREDRRRAAAALAVFLGGCLTVHAFFICWLAAQGSLRDFWLQSVRLALAFSGNNAFSSNEYTAVRILKSLFQIDSPHGGISYLWLVLPLASCAVFFRSAYALAVKEDPSAENKALLAVSSASLGLWLGYYPIPALFHMSLSSVLFFGPLSWLVLAAAGRLGFSGNRLLVLAVPAIFLLPDFGYRLRSFVAKMAEARAFERIESPEFLRGMYVPAGEKKAFAEIGKLISGSRGRLLNLTNSALYSLYKEDGSDLHKMPMDWGWINSFLYPDYLPAVAGQILTGEGCILSTDAYMVPGYVPVKVFPAFVGGEITNKPVVLSLPGRRAPRLGFTGAGTELRRAASDRLPLGYRFSMKAGKVPAALDSVVIKILSKLTVQERIPRYEFEYELLPKLFDPAEKEKVKKGYAFDPGLNAYVAAVPLDGKAGLELLDALSGAFLYEKNSFLADTFQTSKNTGISVYRNGKGLKYSDFFDGTGYKAGDAMDFVVPTAAIPDTYVARIRVNYKGGEYQEEKIAVYKKR